MVAADALWHVFLKPKQARDDPSSAMQYTGILCPKETGKIGSNPQFRQLHEVITHIGTVLCLDGWRVEVGKNMEKLLSLD